MEEDDHSPTCILSSRRSSSSLLSRSYGRMQYTEEDRRNMFLYYYREKKHSSNFKSLRFWERAKTLNVTRHSSQSMLNHFKKYLQYSVDRLHQQYHSDCEKIDREQIKWIEGDADWVDDHDDGSECNSSVGDTEGKSEIKVRRLHFDEYPNSCSNSTSSNGRRYSSSNSSNGSSSSHSTRINTFPTRTTTSNVRKRWVGDAFPRLATTATTTSNCYIPVVTPSNSGVKTEVAIDEILIKDIVPNLDLLYKPYVKFIRLISKKYNVSYERVLDVLEECDGNLTAAANQFFSREAFQH